MLPTQIRRCGAPPAALVGRIHEHIMQGWARRLARRGVLGLGIALHGVAIDI